MSKYQVISAAAALAAIVDGAAVAKDPPFFPTYYAYGGYPRVMTDIYYGTPPQSPPVSAVVDLGSASYWVDTVNATINYGSEYSFTQGPCNFTARPFYNPAKSKTATKLAEDDSGYNYGGNGKLVYSYSDTNDTLHFNSATGPSLKNRRVSLANYTQIKQATLPGKDACTDEKTLQYDRSILGISQFVTTSKIANTEGTSFRQDLLDEGLIHSKTMSFWFDKTSEAYNSTFYGTVLFGGVPERRKYSGELVKIKLSPPTGYYVGYYLPTPKFTATNMKTGKQVAQKVGASNANCYVDSGSGLDTLPIAQNAFLKSTGLVMHGGYPAWPGPCSSIPANAYITITVPGATKGKSVAIQIPYKNYARGIVGESKNRCALSMQLGENFGCTFAAPSTTAMFMAVNDDTNEFALAQGLASHGARRGVKGLGGVKMVLKGGSIPGAV